MYDKAILPSTGGMYILLPLELFVACVVLLLAVRVVWGLVPRKEL